MAYDGPYLVEDVLGSYQGRWLEELVNVGIIKLIPKDDKRDLVGDWRPVTLLNVSYKILAKALAKRIQMLVDKIFRKERPSFMNKVDFFYII